MSFTAQDFANALKAIVGASHLRFFHWFSGDSGTVINDLSGNGLNIETQVDLSYFKKVKLGAFNGIDTMQSAYWWKINDNDLLSFSNDVSFLCFGNFLGSNATDIIAKYYYPAIEYATFFESNQLKFSIYTNGSNKRVKVINYSNYNYQNKMIVTTFERSTLAQKIYIDGESITTTDASAGTYTGMPNTNVSVGNYEGNYGNAKKGIWYWHAAVDIALTQQQVTDIQNLNDLYRYHFDDYSTQGFVNEIKNNILSSPSNMIVGIPFIEVTGNIAHDYSGNNLHATLSTDASNLSPQKYGSLSGMRFSGQTYTIQDADLLTFSEPQKFSIAIFSKPELVQSSTLLAKYSVYGGKREYLAWFAASNYGLELETVDNISSYAYRGARSNILENRCLNNNTSIIFSCDGSTNGNGRKVYLNGGKIDSAYNNVGSYSQMRNYNVNIGNYIINSSNQIANIGKCVFHGVYIFTEELSQLQATQLDNLYRAFLNTYTASCEFNCESFSMSNGGYIPSAFAMPALSAESETNQALSFEIGESSINIVISDNLEVYSGKYGLFVNSYACEILFLFDVDSYVSIQITRSAYVTTEFDIESYETSTIYI